jgi:hypothetical protein
MTEYSAINLLGVKTLRRHIDTHYGGSVNQFAAEHRFSQSDLAKVLRGERTRFSVGFAYRIQVATRGDVKWTMWLPQFQ